MLRVQQALRMRVGQPWQRNLVGDRHQEGHPEAGGRHHSDPSRNHPGKVFDRSFGDIPWRSSGEPCWSWYWFGAVLGGTDDGTDTGQPGNDRW